MRAVVQRVLSASVTVDSEVVSEISQGLMVLIGIGIGISHFNVLLLQLALKVFPNSSGDMWKANVKDIQGEILCVSQFTLMANTLKGNKPDFHRAMSADQSRSMYASLLQYMGTQYSPKKIKDGRFGAMMNISLINEGPVTFTLDSRKFEYISSVG
ncbi:D-Tyr tRNAtyr deacylase-like domain-containing protein [Multifurca ochricompacta]|uniref:D-aminoacyl-tRNA deacylase n=1 Tax=Multifurca ochricompacta TaxID=376703 RepID=A0AAD4MA94_9AGAM|nr:D-Tyr tRNAtyr deacylase-like domain-containing protein [Multifurca ochricompacta]